MLIRSALSTAEQRIQRRAVGLFGRIGARHHIDLFIGVGRRLATGQFCDRPAHLDPHHGGQFLALVGFVDSRRAATDGGAYRQ